MSCIPLRTTLSHFGCAPFQPFGYVSDKIILVLGDDAIRLNYAYGCLKKSLNALNWPIRYFCKSLVQFRLRWTRSSHQTSEFLKAVQTGQNIQNTFILKAFSFSFGKLHDPINLFNVKQIIRTRSCRKHDNRCFEFSPKHCVRRTRIAGFTDAIFFQTCKFNLVTRIPCDQFTNEKLCVFNDAVIINNPFDSIQPERSVSPSFMANRTDIEYSPAVLYPPRSYSSSAEVISRVAVVDDKEKRLQVIAASLRNNWVIFMLEFAALVLNVNSEFDVNKSTWWKFKNYSNCFSFARRPASQPRKKSHSLVPLNQSKRMEFKLHICQLRCQA